MKRVATFLSSVALASLVGCAAHQRYGHHYRDDAGISADVRSELDTKDFRHVKVETSGGNVYLTGVVRDANARRYAGTIASHTEGVRHVVNDIQLAPTRAGDAPESWEPRGQGEQHYHPWHPYGH